MAAATPPTFISAEPSTAWILGAEALPGHVDPQNAALRWGTTTRTYAELRQRALSLAGALRRRGLQRGDRVVAHLLNRGETFELYFACAYAGLTFVPINWRLTPHEIGLILSDCTPGLVITQDELADKAREAADPLGIDVLPLRDDASGEEYDAMAGGEPVAAPFERADPHMLLYTSGTTGRPKGVMMAHSSIMWFAHQQAALYKAMDPHMVMLIISPTFNTAGINEQSIPTFLAGGTVAILPSRGWRPEKMAKAIDDWAVTHTIVYPSMMEPFLEADREQRMGLESLKFILTGGENCPPATVSRWRRRWDHVTVLQGYGSTETGVVTAIIDDELDRHPGSVGRTAMGMAVKIIDRAGEPVPIGEVGEIWTAGGSISPGYWNAPELTAETLKEGWINTGDLGRMDADGYIFIEGRSRDLIISKGQNIYPAEIENVLSEYEDLLESTVVGVPDEEYGEVVCAVVVPKPGRDLGADDVVAFVTQRLASYKKPRHVVMVDSLPRNPGNKVLKKQVAERAMKELALDVS
jgi:fatty-acyl-CoA synthase